MPIETRPVYGEGRDTQKTQNGIETPPDGADVPEVRRDTQKTQNGIETSSQTPSERSWCSVATPRKPRTGLKHVVDVGAGERVGFQKLDEEPFGARSVAFECEGTTVTELPGTV